MISPPCVPTHDSGRFIGLDRFFRGTVTPQVDALDRLLGEELVAIGDLMMTEVLQGFASERDFNKARRMLGALDLVEIGGVMS
ncbi:hypothetical protein RAA17_26290 [Komagataeibacter rhaeticus]|nr:hypothetical protein [Komagataeibacter rhaeticus]